MDIRAPTHELTRAHAIFRARRRIALGPADWALSPAGLDVLRGRAGGASLATSAISFDDATATEGEPAGNEAEAQAPEPADAWSSELAAIDELLTGSARRVSQATAQRLTPLMPEAGMDDGDEDERFAQWRKVLDQTLSLPPVLAAVLALQEWQELASSKTQGWLGPLLAAALLRSRGKTASHLACLNADYLHLARVRGGGVCRPSGLIHELRALGAAAE